MWAVWDSVYRRTGRSTRSCTMFMCITNPPHQSCTFPKQSGHNPSAHLGVKVRPLQYRGQANAGTLHQVLHHGVLLGG